ncbi:MAG: DNA internalization-related competence protein ComEC/Rec2 [Deltaproteobacteria bacterium]|nr:DNA internalization-related competence protein ComEC/Rec2 [Deltaproteobacteria bacterium]
MIPSGWKGFNSPFLPISLALIAGIWVGEWVPTSISLISLGVTLPLLLFLCRQNKKIAKLLALASLLALGALLIHLRMYPTLVPHHILKIPEGKKVVLTGTIYRPPQRKGEKIVIYLLVERIYEGNKCTPSTGKVRITIRDPALKLRYGYLVRLKAKLYHPRNFRNPGSFDYEGYLRRRGVLVTGYVRGGDQVQILSKKGGNPLLRRFDRWREEIEAFLDENTLPPGRGLLKALLIGERGEIPKEVREAFIDAGAVHILAISGLHLGIIVTLIFLSAQGLLKLSERVLLRYDTRKVAALATFPPLLCYILITGFPISTIRAGIVACCFLVAILLDRYRNPLNTLAFAAFLILLISPTSLWDPSFQLSFSSVLGIILLISPLYRRLFPQDPLTLLTRAKEGRLKRGIALSLIASFAAIVVTSPVVAFHFHRLSTMGLVSNSIIIPLVGLGLLPLGLLCLPFIPIFPSLGALLAKLAAELSHGGIRAMELISSLPFASFYLPSPTAWEMVIFYSFIASLLWLKRSSFRRMAVALILFLVLFDLSYWGLKGYGQKGLQVTFLDVGQGDCALVEFPRGKRMLIDGGGLYGDFDVGEKVVAPFLWEKRILGVDYLVLTHPQPDHYKGLIFVAQHFRVQEFWHNGLLSPAPAYRQLLQVIKEKRIRMVRAEDGFSRSIGGVWVEVLHPPMGWMPGGPRKRGWVNNNSVVLKISFGDHSLLFTGDIEKEAEARLLKASKGLRAQLIKVPHHGSKTSSTYYFVKEVFPLYAVISLGFRNPFHFPSRRVVRRYKGFGCRVLRTDLDGAIMATSDGKRLEVRSFRDL